MKIIEINYCSACPYSFVDYWQGRFLFAKCNHPNYEYSVELTEKEYNSIGDLCPLKDLKENDDTPELRPCPFCGSEVELIVHDEYLYKIECSNEDCLVTTFYETKDAIIKFWNNRV